MLTNPDCNTTLEPLSDRLAESTCALILDPEIRENVGIRAEPSLQRTRAWIAKALTDETIVPFAILHAGTHVGNVVLDKLDRHLGTARLHLYVGREFRGRGIGAAATSLAIRRAFDELSMYKVWLTVHAQNSRAIATYIKLGFEVEGTLRGEFILDGTRIDALYMGILTDVRT